MPSTFSLRISGTVAAPEFSDMYMLKEHYVL